MKEKFKEISESMDRYIETKKFRWFRRLVLVLGFTVTGCVCFLAGFFMNRHDNMIYKSNLTALNRTAEETAAPADEPAVTEVPSETEESVQTSAPVTTEPPKVTLSRDLLDSYIYDDLDFAPFEYRYSNTASFKNRAMIDDFSLPLTKKSFTISYEGVITAGFDPDKIKVENDDELYTVKITFPAAHIISHKIDRDSFELEDVQDNLFNPISREDYISTCEAQNFTMEQKAAASGLYSSLYEQAEQEITDYLMRDSIIGAKYSIEFIRPDIVSSL
ncbi:MAG: DUF4230 domain-containing protein [Oscillospiraceae bacterium]|nr:DUF4230 domain-containing protein [Oscillospiraceae bacterium]